MHMIVALFSVNTQARMFLRHPFQPWKDKFVLHMITLCSCLVLWPAMVGAFSDLEFVIDGEIKDNGLLYTECEGEEIKIGCVYRALVHVSDLRLTTGEQHQNLQLGHDNDWQFQAFKGWLSHTVTAGDALGTKSYECTDGTYHATVTISFVTSVCSDKTTSPSTEPHTSDTTHSTTEPTSTTDSDSGTGSEGTTTSSPRGSSFKGLKPLIYTVASVILLGTLAIVAIITCWIRARRSFHSRIIRPNNTPQDYLDYISDNEFTPLTTSEFLASLQERPPTYNQSEEMTQQMNPEEDTSSDAPPTARRGEEEGDQAAESQEQGSLAENNEGAVVTRRRSRVGSAGRERQRRRRRVVIVESGDSRPEESSVTVTSTEGGVTVTYEEEGGAAVPHPSPQEATPTTRDEAALWESIVAVEQLVPLDSPVYSPAPSSTHHEVSPKIDTPDGLTPAPISEHHTTPPQLGTLTSGEVYQSLSDDLIDFSTPPQPLTTSGDLSQF